MYILSHPRLIRRARMLAQRISEISGANIQARDTFIYGESPTIRYGNSSGIYDVDTLFNKRDLIRLVGNKLSLSDYLTEKDFYHFIRFNYPDDDHDFEGFPIVVRKELNRGGGIGIVIVENREQWTEDLWTFNWNYWYDFQFELGVHILGGEVVKVFKKVRSEGLEKEKYPIRNTQRGYDFKLKNNWKEKYPGLQKFVSKLFEAVPIQFARLDIGYDKDTGGYRLIEINSAPDLSQNSNTLDMYANFLVEKILK